VFLLKDITVLGTHRLTVHILAGGSGNGYRFAELMGASNPSGWPGVIKVNNRDGTTLGYILLYTNP